MIRYGPAGIPLSCKGRTIRDGIEDIHALGLHAMEIQLVRGKAVNELDDFEELGEIAHSLDIYMAIHAPYYMDFLGNGYMRNKSSKFLQFAGEIGSQIGARTIVTHIGPYHGCSSRDAIEALVPMFRELRNYYLQHNYRPSIGVELAGRPDLFGTLREITELCQRVRGLVPIINWAHLHARGSRWLNDRESFKKVFDFFDTNLRLPKFYCHFSGVEFDVDGNERHYAPVKKGEIKFEHLAEVILENNYDVVMISDSPLMEHDAMYMKLITERVESRRQERIARREASERIRQVRKAAVEA
jgi:deoxyribonuclease-4